TSQDGESLESYYSRAEKIARVANLLALVAQQQPVYHPQNHPTHYSQNFSTRSQQAATKNRGKAIINSSQPIYDQEPLMVPEDDETSKDKEIDKLMALISLSFKKIYKPTNNNLRTSSNTSRANQDNSPRINRSAGYENQRIGNVAGASETVGLTVVQKSGIQCYNCKEFRHVAREVILKTSVRRPHLKSNPMGDRVMRNNSQGKKQEVEDQRRNVKLPKNKTSVTACNDSLNAKTLKVNSVSAMCDKCVLIDKHDMCVLNSVAKPIMKIVASESNQKPRNITRKLYERVSKTCSWWYPKFTPSGYKWKPKSGKENINPNLIEIVLFIVDSGCSKHMTGNLKLQINFVEKFLGTRVYYVEGLNHNLFSIGQFYDADLEVAFQKSTCFIRDLKGNDILTGSYGTDLYLITLPDTNCPNPICLMAMATSSQAWLWHRR
nr:hypothetical protein [Tanacetum cinerariifolium]